MDNRIVKALGILGLSPERIDEFATIVDAAKDRIRAEGMVVRGKKASVVMKTPASRGSGSGRVAAATLAKLKPARTLRLSYNGPRPKPGAPTAASKLVERLSGQPAGIPITDRIAELERELEYSDHLTDWQRSRLRRQIRELGALGNTATGQAQATVAKLEASQRKWQRSPRRSAG